MARTIPAPPFVPCQPDVLVPGIQVFGGSATLTGHWRDIVRNINLANSQGHAQTIIAQSWAENQFYVNTAIGGAFANNCAWRYPTLTPQHVRIRCAVFVRGPGTAINLRFTSTPGGGGGAVTTGTISIPVSVVAGAWYSVDFNTNPGVGTYATMVLSSRGTGFVDTVSVQYLFYDPSGLWPGASGAVGTGTVGYCTALDDDEVVPDHALSTDLANYIAGDITQLEARERVYMNVSALENSGVAPNTYPVLHYPHRVCVPVKSSGTDITMYVRAQDSKSDTYIYVLTGGSTFKPDITDAIVDDPQSAGTIYKLYGRDVLMSAKSRGRNSSAAYVTSFVIPANPLAPVISWHGPFTFRTAAVNDLGHGDYPAFVNMAVVAGVRSIEDPVRVANSTLALYAVSMWGW